jgi:hypothetical protein
MKVASLILAVLATLEGLAASPSSELATHGTTIVHRLVDQVNREEIQGNRRELQDVCLTLLARYELFYQGSWTCTCSVENNGLYRVTCTVNQPTCCGSSCVQTARAISSYAYNEQTFIVITALVCFEYTGDIDDTLCVVFEYCDDETVCSCNATMGVNQDNQCQTCSLCFTSDGQTVANFDCTNVPGGELFLSTDCTGELSSFTESCSSATAVPTEVPSNNEFDICQLIESLNSDHYFYQDHPCTCEVNDDGSYNVTCVATNEKCCGNVCSRDLYQADIVYDGETALSDGETQCTRYSGDMDTALCIEFSYCSPDSDNYCSCRAALGDTACLSCSLCPYYDDVNGKEPVTFDCTNVPGGDLFLVSECGILDPILDTCSDATTSSIGGSATSTSAASSSAPSSSAPSNKADPTDNEKESGNLPSGTTTTTNNEKDAAVSILPKHALTMLSLATLVIIYYT